MDNINTICNYFLDGVSKEQNLGVELEHFICDDELKMIPYETLCDVMKEAGKRSGGTLVYDQGHILGLDCGIYGISLEPAGQVEISINPTNDLKEIDRIYSEFRRLWETLLSERGYQFVERGVHPLVETGETDPSQWNLIPKKRYEYMDQYFMHSGEYGRYMMRASASTQISIDYSSEKDAMKKMRILSKLSPLLTLVMENLSGSGCKKEWKPHLLRSQIWNGVDPDRCGYFPGSLDETYSFHDYAEYVYNKPMIFLKDKDEEWNVQSKSAGELCKERKFTFTEHLLSMFFPHIRLKKYVEIRVADSVDKERMLGYAALIKGLMYDENNLAALEKMLVKITTIEQIKEAEQAIMSQGYYAAVYGKTAVEWIWELYELAKQGLSMEDQNYLKGLVTLPMLEYEYRKDISEDLEGHTLSGLKQKEYILNSTAKYHNRAARTIYIPKMFTQAEISCFSSLVEELFGIFDKVIAEYKKNPQYRRLFGFDERTEALILKEEAYKCNVPMARVDIFYNEETKEFYFCEFNTDGTSAMNEDRELNIAVKLTKAYQAFAQKHKIATFELFDSWVEEFLNIYGEYASKYGKRKVPNVVITDYLEHATINEFKVFQERFRKHGIPCEICDVKDLVWDGEALYTPGGMQVDAIYRRAVTSDLLSEYDQSLSLIQAVKNNAVCMVGEFKTQIVHNKILYKILHLPETGKLLTARERRYIKAHVPYTVSLTKEHLEKHPDLKESVFQEKDNWIIKPEDSYGSFGVHAGVECDEQSWDEFVNQAMDQGYILQRFCTPYRLPNIDLLDEKKEVKEWCTTSNLTGLFVYNGKLKGVYSRTSFDQMISTQYNEMTLATMVVEP